MGYASQELIDRAEAVLSTGSFQQKLDFLKETPINPPDGILIPKYVRGYQDPPDGQQPDEQFADWSKLKIDQTVDMIGFIRMGAVTRDQVGALTFRVKSPRELRTTASRAGYVPVWWLPWKSAKIVKIKIADMANHAQLQFGAGIDAQPNPGIFFTAAINGCSVFAVGSPDKPSVYHAGITGSLKSQIGPARYQGLGGTSERVWEALVGRAPHGTKRVGQVNRNDYVAERVSTNPADDRRISSQGDFTTFRGRSFEGFLSGQADLDAVKVTPWGCVFGVRDNNDAWRFVLVKNATVEYFRMTHKKRRFRSSKSVRTMERMPNQNAVRADGTVDDTLLQQLDNPYFESKFMTCVNLGHQEFFPGHNAAAYHDFSTINLV